MSCYEWEHGRITLPSGEAPRIRNAVAAAAGLHRDKLYDAAQRFWDETPRSHRRDEEKYQVAVSAFLHGNKADEYGWPRDLPDKKLPAWRGIPGGDGYHGFWFDLQNLIGYSVLGKRVEVTREPTWEGGKPFTTTEYVKTPPRRVQKKDVEALIGKTTGTKFTVHCGEPSITFAGRVVEWDVPNNNHACEHGREHEIARAFFRALNDVSWTRGSGGTIVGNNEYNGDSQTEGAGGNYVVTEYGSRATTTTTRRRVGGRR